MEPLVVYRCPSRCHERLRPSEVLQWREGLWFHRLWPGPMGWIQHLMGWIQHLCFCHLFFCSCFVCWLPGRCDCEETKTTYRSYIYFLHEGNKNIAIGRFCKTLRSIGWHGWNIDVRWNRHRCLYSHQGVGAGWRKKIICETTWRRSQNEQWLLNVLSNRHKKAGCSFFRPILAEAWIYHESLVWNVCEYIAPTGFVLHDTSGILTNYTLE